MLEHVVTPRPEYDRKPLTEAIFELFVPNETLSHWDRASIGRIATRLPEYSFHEEQLKDIGIQFQVGPEGTLKPQVHSPRDRTRRWDRAHSRAVQFGSHMCAYNLLGPAYTHFHDHSPTIADVFRSYLAEANPERLAWVGQRYLNEVKVPIADQNVASFFLIYPKLPDDLSGHRPLAVQVQTVELKSGVVVVNLSLQRTDDVHATYLLDIYARSDGTMPVDPETIMTWQAVAHDAVHRSFDLSISNRCKRELLGERTNE